MFSALLTNDQAHNKSLITTAQASGITSAGVGGPLVETLTHWKNTNLFRLETRRADGALAGLRFLTKEDAVRICGMMPLLYEDGRQMIFQREEIPAWLEPVFAAGERRAWLA